MKREDIREIYSISVRDGVTIIIKRDESYLKREDEYGYIPDLLINPNIQIMDNGILMYSGTRLSYTKIRNRESWTWVPKPLSELKDNWRDLIFYEEENIIQKDVVEWVPSGIWPFKKRIKHKDVDHLQDGYYLKKTGYVDTQSTSNFRIVGFKSVEIGGKVN